MTYYMLDIEIYSPYSAEDADIYIASMLFATYSPHLWNSSIAYMMLGWRRSLILRRLAQLPQDEAMSLLRAATQYALSALGGE